MEGSAGQGFRCCFKRLSDADFEVLSRGKFCPAISTKLLGPRILGMTLRASDRHESPPIRLGKKISRNRVASQQKVGMERLLLNGTLTSPYLDNRSLPRRYRSVNSTP